MSHCVVQGMGFPELHEGSMYPMTDERKAMQHFVVARYSGRHLAFPDVCRLGSGEILVVFREGASHVDYSGRIMICRCSPGNDVGNFSIAQLVCKTELDDRDPSIVQLSNGTVLVNFFRMDIVNQKLFLSIVRSHDQGQSWDVPYDVELPEFSNGLAVSDAILEFPSGELIMPVYGVSDEGENGSFLLRSQDEGRSWPVVVPLAVASRPIFEEPTLGRLGDGRLLALLRTDQKGRGSVYQSISQDEGFTWSTPERLSLWGYPADLLLLKSGRMLATYGYRQLPTGIRYCLSQEGPSWSIYDEHIIRADGHDGGELGYPTSVELDNGEVMTVYYYTDESGGMPYIAGTRYVPQSKKG